jgi:hypothetical protein
MNEKSLTIDISQSPWISCEKGNMLWDSSTMAKRISPLVSPTGKEEILPVEVVICKTCGKIPKFFHAKFNDIPEELKSDCNE